MFSFFRFWLAIQVLSYRRRFSFFFFSSLFDTGIWKMSYQSWPPSTIFGAPSWRASSSISSAARLKPYSEMSSGGTLGASCTMNCKSHVHSLGTILIALRTLSSFVLFFSKKKAVCSPQRMFFSVLKGDLPFHRNPSYQGRPRGSPAR